MKRHLSLLFTAIAITAAAQEKFPLEEIMKGPGFTGHSPENVRWSADSKTIRFSWNPDFSPGNSSFSATTEGAVKKEPDILPLIPDATENQNPAAAIYANRRGELVRYIPKTGLSEVVFSTAGRIYNLQNVANENHVYFENNGELFLYNGENGSVLQVTRFREGITPKQADSSMLMKQQTELFDYLRRQRDSERWSETHKVERKQPKTIYYRPGTRIEDLTISTDERFITFLRSTYPSDSETYIEQFITSDGYTRRVPARPKVGNEDPIHEMSVFDRLRDTAYTVSFSGLSGIRSKPAYLREYGDTSRFYSADRKIVMHRPVMHPDAPLALVDVRSYDNKDRWIVLLDLERNTVSELDRQHDDAWIGGPGISGWNAEEGTLFWLDKEQACFQSEVSGFSHVYKVNIHSGKTTRMTQGNWEVHQVIPSRDRRYLYLITNMRHPGVRNGYRYDIRNQKMIPLFTGDFGMEWTLSPNEKYWAIRKSSATEPWDLYIAENKPGASMKRLTETATPAYLALGVKPPEIIEIPASDGKVIYARLYAPENPNGAAVMFVHGAGYLQNAHHYWSHYQREFLFHNLLADKGYTVLDIDYRASEGYGRDVRTAIYRHMGERDLLDYVDGRQFLVGRYGIDSSRIGIYGGSYGGFLTLMAMLKTPGTFACGAALRAVTDWAHYNHEYTSNILNYPATDPVAYRRSSPVYFAEGLNGPLLMLHGMMDDNVQFQDIVRLHQRFIELRKTNFELAVFPTEAHGFDYTPAWIDEYRRILALFETYLK